MFDEKTILSWLSDFGAVPAKLLCQFVPDEEHSALFGCLKRMSKAGILKLEPNQEENPIVKINSHFPLDAKKTKALWVASRFRDNFNLHQIGPLDFPSQLFFLSNIPVNDSIQYEISVFEKDDEPYLRLLKFNKHVNYVIVLPSSDFIMSALSYLQLSSFPSEKLIFTCVEGNILTEVPTVKFFRIGGNGDA